ncbi:MAG TPA: hypothetical protein VF194_01245 [Ferrovibrio sp.]|uniref:hypothetical protein n=1 Tax=Ferrovibrio sp. TaxID=1917215 RepID=UPI002ED5536C
MGDRYFDHRHPNIELLLRRPPSLPSPLPGIGHNGGPPLDMSWKAWLWRRAIAKTWETPPREIALRRLRRAEALGLTYRDYAAALLDTGSHLSTALLPLHHVAAMQRRRDGGMDLAVAPRLADCIARFNGRLLIVIDEAYTGRFDRAGKRRLRAALQSAFEGRFEALIVLPYRTMEGDAAIAAHLGRQLAKIRVPRKEAFYLGATAAELSFAEAAGLGFFKPIHAWFADR